jgi:hypothetical protein
MPGLRSSVPLGSALPLCRYSSLVGANWRNFFSFWPSSALKFGLTVKPCSATAMAGASTWLKRMLP